MQNISSMPKPEILLVADAAAREKGIDKEEVFEAMEVAIQKAGRSRYGSEHDIRVSIDRKTGAITMSRYREVVADDAEIENEPVLPFSIVRLDVETPTEAAIEGTANASIIENTNNAQIIFFIISMYLSH